MKWKRVSDAALLSLQLSDLRLDIAGSWVEPLVVQLYAELEAVGIVHRPTLWISDAWFCPDGSTGFALPFYLFHPRLARLEKHMIGEVEGETPNWCMKLLRHEAAHALDNAYGLRRRKARQQVFGLSSLPYPDHYTPQPYSRRFVDHLGAGYAQAHPDEDWAETFAVWLDPNSAWRRRYAAWPALQKLHCVDAIMRSLQNRPPTVTQSRPIDPLSAQRLTLAQHYREKRRHYRLGDGSQWVEPLTGLISHRATNPAHCAAHRFLRRERRTIGQAVAARTGTPRHLIDRLLEQMIDVCAASNIHLCLPPAAAGPQIIERLAAHTPTFLAKGLHQIPM